MLGNQEYLETVYSQRCVLLGLCAERRALQTHHMYQAQTLHLEKLVRWARNLGAHQVSNHPSSTQAARLT